MYVVVREARPDDAAPMIVFTQRLIAEPNINITLATGVFNLTVDEERMILERYAASENSVFLVAELGAQIIGLLNCDGGRQAAIRYVLTLGVSVGAEWRNWGVGGALMTQAIACRHILDLARLRIERRRRPDDPGDCVGQKHRRGAAHGTGRLCVEQRDHSFV
ncbi:MAG: hypothetical protein MI924_06930 [Chloroflexales bacterium]|nr:hypothetical protein [Chloroflexales bacterium]